MTSPVTQISRATLADVEYLLRLYQVVYDGSYPISYGTDRDAARRMILSEKDRWYVARDPATGRPIASVIFDLDLESKIGKVVALVVHPDHGRKGLASALLAKGCEEILGGGLPINSLYATTRTNSVGPQLVFLKNAFLPLGIFPNCHKLKDYETVTLLVRYRPGVLERRRPIEAVPENLMPLLTILEKSHGIATPTRHFKSEKKSEQLEPQDITFELISAPGFVKRRFFETFTDPYDRFFPFHEPNFLIVSADGQIEAYAYVSAKDRYCAIISLNVPVYSLHGKFYQLLGQLKEAGISYIELLMGLDYSRSIDAAMHAGFLPSALYPAMRENENGEMEDFVVLSRTLEPLSFRGMAIDGAFEPFVEQYVDLWKKHALESLEIVHAHR